MSWKKHKMFNARKCIVILTRITHLSSEADCTLLHVLHGSVSAGPHDLENMYNFIYAHTLPKSRTLIRPARLDWDLQSLEQYIFFPHFIDTYVMHFCCYQVGCTGTSGCGGRPPWSPGALQTHIMRETTKSQKKSNSLKPDDKVVSHLLWYWHRGAEVCLWVLG